MHKSNSFGIIFLISSSSILLFKVIPSFDTLKYYAMPWGNYKPICEIPCMWEDNSHRIEQSNAIIKVIKFLICGTRIWRRYLL